MLHNLTQDVRIDQALPPASRAAGTVTSTYLSMDGHEMVTALLSVGAITASGTIDMKLVQATDTSGTGSKDIAGASLVQIADTGGAKMYAIDFRGDLLDHTNGFTCVAVVLTTAAAANVSSVTFLRYRGRRGSNASGLTQRVLKVTQ
ncbi:hypothetical protein [Herpetosiphon geysericola]|uniref:hypothetical protein n=1 Tax=Herpetosiphon geysericola TaxID=70996 RepID=UPI0006C93637|nr:hypothetical protein [Herpetosiphon geysericola]